MKLKYLFTTFCFLLMANYVVAQNKAANLFMDSTSKFPKIAFVNLQHDFGKIRKGEKINTSFHFKNIGMKPVQILQVQTTCGCTITEWSKTPIASGGTGEINVTFDTTVKDMTGKQTKTLLVISNALNKEVLISLEGEIITQ